MVVIKAYLHTLYPHSIRSRSPNILYIMKRIVLILCVSCASFLSHAQSTSPDECTSDQNLEALLATVDQLQSTLNGPTLEVADCWKLITESYAKATYTSGFTYAEEAFKIYDDLLDDTDPRFMEAFEWYAAIGTTVYDRTGVLSLLERKVNIYQKVYGYNDPKTEQARTELEEASFKDESYYIVNSKDKDALSATTDYDQGMEDWMVMGGDQMMAKIEEMNEQNALLFEHIENKRYKELEELFNKLSEDPFYRQNPMYDVTKGVVEGALQKNLGDEEGEPYDRMEVVRNTTERAALAASHEIRRPGFNILDYMGLIDEEEGINLIQQHSLIVHEALENPGDAETAETALNVLLEVKSLFLELSILREARLKSVKDSEVDALRAERAQVSRQMSALYLRNESQEEELMELMGQRFQIEAQMNERVPAGYSWDSDEMMSYVEDWTAPVENGLEHAENIQAVLPENSVLIEFVTYWEGGVLPENEEYTDDKAIYAAFVVQRDKPVRGVQLSKVLEVDGLIRNYHTLINIFADPEEPTGRKEEASLALEEIRSSLHSTLIAPLGLGQEETVFISPDGNLFTLPFETLTNPLGKDMVDQYVINYIGTGRDITNFKPTNNQGDMYVFANADFGSGSTFVPLPGTAQEASSIQQSLGLAEERVFVGQHATDENLTAIQNPWRLHVATHGYFSQENVEELQSTNAAFMMGFESAMLRSGLALTGANNTLNGENEGSYDGIVTAYELSNMSLQGTDMVVLSACETGLGDVINGDGVYGLQRAFQLAGAETVVMSLWKVSDEATRDLMVNFYSKLNSSEKNKAKALREAVLEIKKEYPHPYYWGAFVLTGNPE